MLRAKVGVLAILLLTATVVLWLGPWQGDQVTLWMAACRRVGLVLACLWLAMPELQRLSPWYAVTAVGVLIVLVRFPKFFVVAAIVGALVLLLRPRMQSPPKRSRRAG